MARLRIAEPATVLTDLVLGGQTLWYANRLRRGPARGPASGTLWALALAAAGVAALAGALTHAISEDADAGPLRRIRIGAWRLVGLAMTAASAFMLAGGVAGGVRAGVRRPYVAATAAKAVISAVAGWRTGNYLFVILDYAASMVVVLGFQVRAWRMSAAAPWLTGGILLSFLAAGIQRSGVALHARFNHNDLYHVVQMGAFHLLYEGACRSTDWETGEETEQSSGVNWV